MKYMFCVSYDQGFLLRIIEQTCYLKDHNKDNGH